ncbi:MULTISPECIES: hypothetical protein [Azohydromonas]|jgi:hypothetical protein|uniref:Lipoprotein n=1 Tax=Azohydromonas lata TaxID=45677 RepID=A0ABU5IAX1_9BURK|nr:MULTISPECIES: hypothetical protein [Azohydromonas]MDZ5455690.1 hypothetical protein [Azohydromonas lata]
MTFQRTGTFAALLAAATLLVGCTSPQPRHIDASGRYCFRASESPTSTCTLHAIPSEQVEADVKRFEPEPGALTLLIVRNRWADAVNQVDVSVDGAGPITTVPESLVQVRLPAGRHRLALWWDATQSNLDIDGAAGDVRFVEIQGSTWFVGSRYRWFTGDEAGARSRALSSRLIAVMDLAR